MRHGSGLHEGFAIARFFERTLASFPHAVCDHIHRRFEIDLLPLATKGAAVLHLGQTVGMGVQLERIRALRAKPPAGNWRLGISFDGNQLVSLMVDKLPAADGAVRTDGARRLSTIRLRAQVYAAIAHSFQAGSVR